jgi:uncharacterized UPF0146 family protein
MDNYKHIERAIGRYIATRYRNVVEVGVGRNPGAARILTGAGVRVLCTDIKNVPPDEQVPFAADDIFSPDIRLYKNADLIYAIRPAVEMIPPLIALAQRVRCDLIVYHLGFETYSDGGEVIDCGVLLHRYHRGQNSSKSVD